MTRSVDDPPWVSATNAPDFLKWVDDTLVDQCYVDLHDARNPFAHSWLRQHHFGGTENRGHVDRSQFEMITSGLQTNARKMIVDSASLALDRVRAFVVAVVDQN